MIFLSAFLPEGKHNGFYSLIEVVYDYFSDFILHFPESKIASGTY